MTMALDTAFSRARTHGEWKECHFVETAVGVGSIKLWQNLSRIHPSNALDAPPPWPLRYARMWPTVCVNGADESP